MNPGYMYTVGIVAEKSLIGSKNYLDVQGPAEGKPKSPYESLWETPKYP